MAFRLPFPPRVSEAPPLPRPIRHLDLADEGLPPVVVWMATHDLHGEPLPQAGLARIGPPGRLHLLTTTAATTHDTQELAS